MRFAVDFSGPDRLLFSSDHPWVDPMLILQTLRGLKLSVDDERRILFANARELFGL
jgi:predicted TIM-barrel fold metal-dependent hydrolase